MSVPYLPYGRVNHALRVPGAPALAVERLTVGYPDGGRPALEEVSLCVPAGARVALVGPNGAGKSTLLKVAAGLLPAAAGTVRVFGQPLGACHHRVAYLPQRSDADWRFPLSVARLVMSGRYVHLGWLRRPGPHDHAVVAAALDRLGLTALAARQVGQLSGGQQQRTLLARALAQEAELLLLDEPLNAVDAETRAAVEDLLRDLRREDRTVVVATHDLGRLETDFDGALYLSEGRETPAPPGSFAGRSVGREAVWAG
jgi:manganese/zinc/iron transport system ATP- binding protein